MDGFTATPRENTPTTDAGSRQYIQLSKAIHWHDHIMTAVTILPEIINRPRPHC